MSTQATATDAERSDLDALPAPMTEIDSRHLTGYANEAWEVAARLRGALLLLDDSQRAEESDEIQYAMRLIRDGIERAEGLALAVFDGLALDSERSVK